LPDLNLIPAFIWRELGKPQKCIRLAVVAAEIRTTYFLTRVTNTPIG